MNMRKRLSGWGPFFLTSLLDQMELLLWGEGSQVCVCVCWGGTMGKRHFRLDLLILRCLWDLQEVAGYLV